MSWVAEHWHQLRNATLFVVGLLGAIHETLFTDIERPSLLILFAAMMGLPAFLKSSNGEKKT
jgi:hypothetical protein